MPLKVGDQIFPQELLQDVVAWQGGSQEELAAKAIQVFKHNLAETLEAIGMLEAVCCVLRLGLRYTLCVARQRTCCGQETPLAW